jgi:Tripartite tricarboxylate transporter TctB family
VIIPIGISITDEYGLNPRVFPLTVMWLGTAVALILVGHRLREKPAVADDPAPMNAKNWLFIAAMSAYLAATYFAITIVGFKIAGPACVAVLMAVMGEYRHPVRLVLVSLTFPLLVYYAFDRLFIIQLP